MSLIPDFVCPPEETPVQSDCPSKDRYRVNFINDDGENEKE
jgi:hypothetical protein